MFDRTKEAINKLKSLLNMKFGGKDFGRYRLSRKSLLLLWGRKTLRDSDISNLISAGAEQEIIITTYKDYFFVLEARKMENWRSVPLKLIRE